MAPGCASNWGPGGAATRPLSTLPCREPGARVQLALTPLFLAENCIMERNTAVAPSSSGSGRRARGGYLSGEYQMFRTSLRARRGRLGSSLAIALAFAGGTAVSMAAAAPAYAKDKNKDEAKPAAKTQYSPAVVAAYKPLEALLAKAQD